MLYEKIFGQKLEKDLFANSLSGQRAHERKVIVVEFVTVAKIFETAAKNRIEANSIYVHTSIESSPDSPSNYYSRQQRSCPVHDVNDDFETFAAFESIVASTRRSTNDVSIPTSDASMFFKGSYRTPRDATKRERRSRFCRWRNFDSRLRSLGVPAPPSRVSGNSHFTRKRRKNKSQCCIVRKHEIENGRGQERGEGGKSNEMAVDRKTRW